MSAMTEHPTGQLEEHLLRLLLPAAEAEVTAHLAACAQCGSRAGSLEQTLGLLALTAPPQVRPPDVEDQSVACINVLQRAEHVTTETPAGVSATPVSNAAEAAHAPAAASLAHRHGCGEGLMLATDSAT